MFDDYEELWTLCGKSKFVDEGYRKWRNLAENQLTRMGDARTLRSFSEALTKLCKHITLIRVVFSWIIGSASLCFKALTYCYIVFHHGNLKLTSSYLRQPQICYIILSVVALSYHVQRMLYSPAITQDVSLRLTACPLMEPVSY